MGEGRGGSEGGGGGGGGSWRKSAKHAKAYASQRVFITVTAFSVRDPKTCGVESEEYVPCVLLC